MENQKPLQFTGSVGSFFINYVIVVLMSIIPLFGWVLAFNYSNKYLAENGLINGKKVVYQASFMETLKFMVINLLLTIVTFGIYIFWFTVKSYHFITDHLSYADASEPSMAAAAPVAADPILPITPVASPTPVQPIVPTLPATPASVQPAVEAPTPAPVIQPAQPAVASPVTEPDSPTPPATPVV